LEYLIGSLLAIAVFYFFNRDSSNKTETRSIMPKIFLSQAYTYNLIKPALPVLELLAEPDKLVTQSSKHEESKLTRVLVLENTAYWITNNQVYYANISEDKIDMESTSVVDTMGMDKVELDKMIFIIDKLTEGTDNDHSNSGNKEF
jgi:predicted membrane protein